MNIEYLNSLPEVENKYKVELQDDEKVVFVAKLSTFGTEKDRMLGTDSKFTLTNKRILADNNVGIWTIDIENDIVSCTKVKGGWFIFKYVYFSVTLNKEIVFDNGKQKLNGFHFYFKENETIKFEEIMNNIIN